MSEHLVDVFEKALKARDVHIAEQKARIAELEESFALYYDAIQRGTKLWQKATGLHEVLPDTAELVAWLLDLVHRASTNPDTNCHELVVGEPDAAPPKELRGVFDPGSASDDLPVLPLDAAPVAWRWELSGTGDPMRYGTHKPSGKVLNPQPLYAHPEDAPGGPKCVRESELDVAGAQFGIAFVDRGPNDHHQIAELYSEDDTSWGFVHDFSHLWLGDLRQVCDDALDRLKGETK